MRYSWDEGVVGLDGERVGITGADFWERSAALEVDGERWAFAVERDGMTGSRVGADGSVLAPEIVIERGAPWRDRCRVLGPSGSTLLRRTTTWWLGKLHFDVERDGDAIGEIVPEGPWRYRPTVALRAPLTHAEAIFLLWAAYRIDASRPVRMVSGAPGAVSGGG